MGPKLNFLYLLFLEGTPAKSMSVEVIDENNLKNAEMVETEKTEDTYDIVKATQVSFNNLRKLVFIVPY